MDGSWSRSWRLPKGAPGRDARVFAERGGACRGRRGAGLLVMVAAVLAAFAVPGLSRPVALASSSPVLNWTKQAPATIPPARADASMAYDAATRTVVLFGGGARFPFADTWTWDGSTWTKQHPATHPSARESAPMAYDAATGTVVLFGGIGRPGQTFADTWTWDGSTWTKQHPATSPPVLFRASMAYDAATRTVVLFGGGARRRRSAIPGPGTAPPGPSSTPRPARPPGSTRRWPTTRPPAPWSCSAASAATTTLGDTWTWDGSTWTKQHPATSPPARDSASMAYDAATGTAVLFGGALPHLALADTWTWDGSTWTKQHPATSPPARAARRWPTTRPPAPRSCSAASKATERACSTTSGPGALSS